jgi:hypothetical protein
MYNHAAIFPNRIRAGFGGGSKGHFYLAGHDEGSALVGSAIGSQVFGGCVLN